MTTPPDEMLCALPGHDAAIAPCKAIRDWLGENARRFNDRTAVEGIRRPVLSHTELHRQVLSIGDQLRERGIGRGDVVMISLGMSPNRWPSGPPVLPVSSGDSPS